MAKKQTLRDSYLTKIQKEDDFEIGFGLEELMSTISMSFDQKFFDQKFKDVRIEKQFQKWIHPSIVKLGKIIIIEIAIMACLLLFNIVMIFIQDQVDRKGGIISMAFILGGYGIGLVIYILSKRYLILALQLTNFLSLVLTMVATEVSVHMGKEGEISSDGAAMAGLIVLQSLLSLTSYNQMILCFSYIINLAYLLTRVYMANQSNYKFGRFAMVISGVYCLLYTFSRIFQQREREKFIQYQRQTKLLRLFHNLIKVFNDGILITKDDNIIFYNKQISKIFNLPLCINTTDHESSLEDSSVCDKIDKRTIQIKKELLKDAMKRTQHKVNKEQMDLDLKAGSLSNQSTDLWTFIQKFSGGNTKVSCRDSCFTFKDQNNNQNKKLQTQSQNMEYHETNLIISCIRDQSHWIELQKQKAVQQSQKIAFASTAHEFRNPLNAIVSSLTFLEPSITNPKNKEYFNTAKNCTNLMLYLVKDILDLSQIESNSLLLNFSEVNLIETVNFCFDMFSLKAKQKGINLIFDKNQAQVQQIKTDGGRLQQILINLISNSLKYTEKGYIHINIGQDQVSNQMILSIEDTGVGMTQEQLSRLFECFTKIMSNRHLNKEGVGLGMSISLKLAKALGGDLHVASEINQGTVFTLRLPLYHLNRTSSIRQIPKQLSIQIESEDVTMLDDTLDVLVQYTDRKRSKFIQASTRNLKIKDQTSSVSLGDPLEQLDDCHMKFDQCHCPKVLIVDDEPFNVMVQQEIFVQSGIETSKEFSGQAALNNLINNSNLKSCVIDNKTAKHYPYTLVTLDNSMPGMNGYQVAEKIKNLQYSNQISNEMKICLITGDELLLNDNQYKEIFDFIILKPIDQMLLKDILHQCKLI